MPAAVFLEPAHLEVEPGREVVATVTVRNTGQIVDEFRIDVVGAPSAWATVSPASISLFPGAGGAVQVRFAPPRSAAVEPRTEQYGIRVRSSVDPSFSYVEEGVVRVLPFAELAARLVPRASRASLLGRRARHRLVLENTGNAPLPVEAAAADPDEQLRLAVTPRAVVVAPGGSAEMTVAGRAPGRVVSGPARTLPFVVAVAPTPDAPPTALLTAAGPTPARSRSAGRLDPLLPATGTMLRVEGTVTVRPLLAFGLAQLAAVAIPIALVAVVALQLSGVTAAPASTPTASVVPSAAVASVEPLDSAAPTETPTAQPSLAAATEAPTATPAATLSLIAFETVRDGTLDVLATSPDGGPPVIVASTPKNEMYPAMSPDGTRVAYGVEDLDTMDIYVTEIATGATRRLTSGSGYNSGPAWSPDGLRLAFVSSRDGTTDLYTMNADGSRQRRLLEAPDLAEGTPTWSPDGTTIAFAASATNGDGTLRPSALYAVAAAGGPPTRLTEEDGSGSPAWSPDGTRIAFDSPRDDPNRSIFVMGADGSNVTRITPGGWGGAADPTWSPDATEIAFTRSDGSGIYVQSAEGGVPTLVEGTGGADMPSWR